MEIVITILCVLGLVILALLFSIGIEAKRFRDYLASECTGDCDQGRRCTCCKNNPGK